MVEVLIVKSYTITCDAVNYIFSLFIYSRGRREWLVEKIILKYEILFKQAI